jgi:transcription elongation GreA/GreB family factor
MSMTPDWSVAEASRMENGGDVVRVGSRVNVRDGDLTEWWRIVADHEADAVRRLMSDATPMAEALLGHQVGDTVRVRDRNGGGRRPVTIVDVSN